MLPFIEYCVSKNVFPFLQVIPNLPEGRGLFATHRILKYTFVCNYGGILLSHQEGLRYLDAGGNFCYVYEFNYEKDGKNIIQFLNHSKQTFSFGKFINHSKPHFNVIKFSSVLMVNQKLCSFPFLILTKVMKFCLIMVPFIRG